MMATLAPTRHCLVCGERLEFEIDPDRPIRKGWFAPTNYRAKSHTCPPGAAEKWRDEISAPRTTLADGTQVYPEHRNIIKEGPFAGQQEGYVVLAEEERAKGFLRPYRDSYKHLKCGTVTTMGRTLAETYARDPHFYGGTYCAGCGAHFPVGENGEFVWSGTNIKVGT